MVTSLICNIKNPHFVIAKLFFNHRKLMFLHFYLKECSF